jgi:FtsZ-interacting cell division protein ZipA
VVDPAVSGYTLVFLQVVAPEKTRFGPGPSEESPMPMAALIVAAVVIVAILVAVAWSSARRQRSQGLERTDKLREQFGPEYERTVAEKGDTRSGEKELTARQERVSRFDIRHLTTDEGKGFSDEWQVVQASFVDDPSTAVHDADALVGRVMVARGYPVSDYEQRSADMSVDHSPALAHYRAAHDIALRDAQGQANTEDLRQAVISSHVFFSELVEESRQIETHPETPVLVAAQ